MSVQRRIYSRAEESQAWHVGRERAESRTGDLRRELLTFLRLLLAVVSKFLQFARRFYISGDYPLVTTR